MVNKVYVDNAVRPVAWNDVPDNRVNSVEIEFSFSDEWKDLICVAEFVQGKTCILQLISGGKCIMPAELKHGYVTLTVFGNKADGSAYKATTIKYEFPIYESGLCAESTPPVPPSPDLYEQLIAEFLDMSTKDVDQIFNALSSKAQSGVAVEQARKKAVDEANKYTDEQLLNFDAIKDISELKNNIIGYGVKYGTLYKQFNGRVQKVVCYKKRSGACIFLKLYFQGYFYVFKTYANYSSHTNLINFDGSEYVKYVIDEDTEELVTTKGQITNDYSGLINKPSINGVELSGNKTTAQLGIKEGVSQEYVDGIKSNLDDEINLLTGEVSDVKQDIGLIQTDQTLQNQAIQKNVDDIIENKKYTEQNFANIIRNHAEGTVISVNDVSPFPQIVETKVERVNEIPFPYYSVPSGEGTVEINGVTWSVDKDGVITANGTATDDSVFFVMKPNLYYIPTDGKFFSGCPKGGGYSEYFLTILGIIDDLGDGKKVPNGYDTTNGITARIKAGYTAKNIVFKPQLEKGTVATPYTPYIPDLTQARLSVLGKNLLDLNKFTSISGRVPISVVGDTIIQEAAAQVYGVVYKGNCSVFKIGKTYDFTIGSVTDHNPTFWGFRLGYTDGTYSDYLNKQNLQITIPKAVKNVYFYIGSPYNGNKKITYNQIMARDSSAESKYEPYQETVYTPTADGTVEDVQSVSTNMTAFGEGLYVSMKYNADTKKYIDNKFNELTKAVTTAQALALEV